MTIALPGPGSYAEVTKSRSDADVDSGAGEAGWNSCGSVGKTSCRDVKHRVLLLHRRGDFRAHTRYLWRPRLARQSST